AARGRKGGAGEGDGGSRLQRGAGTGGRGRAACTRVRAEERGPFAAGRSGDSSCGGAGGARDRAPAERSNAARMPPDQRRPLLLSPASRSGGPAPTFPHAPPPFLH